MLGLFTLPLETWWGGGVEYALGLHFASPALVMLAIKLGTNVDRPWARPARAFTLPLYLWHMLFVMPMATAVTLLGLDARLRWLIAPAAVALCYLVYRIQGLWKARRAGKGPMKRSNDRPRGVHPLGHQGSAAGAEANRAV